MYLEGMSEHYDRMSLYISLADENQDEEKFRLLMAAVYSAQAIIENGKNALEKNNISENDYNLIKLCFKRVPYADIIYCNSCEIAELRLA
ncbi:MAG: hypothetical protein H7A37_07010 [Chlamydiales bacterium]|nr:hypothetical protein [Chlamydiales bacterium]